MLSGAAIFWSAWLALSMAQAAPAGQAAATGRISRDA